MNKKFILGTPNYYTMYFIDNNPRPTIVVSPGGGYAYTSERESAPVADIFNSYGYHVVVVNYRETVNEAYPMPGKYLAEAINEISTDHHVSNIILMGFSAGGHNALDVCLHSNDYKLKYNIKMLILGYPVITADARYRHEGSFKNLLLNSFTDEKLLEYVSLEKHINEDAPDLFLWGTITDESVSVKNSWLLLEAYKKHNLNVEYHMFDMGGHGLSVCNEASAQGDIKKVNPYIAKWSQLAHEWIQLKLEKYNSI